MKTFFFIVFLWGVLLCSLGFLSVLADTQDPSDNVECPTGWTTVDRGCYMFLEEDTYTWDNANENCKKEGGQLVSIAGDREKTKLEAFLKKGDVQESKWWVGFRKVRGNDWQWLDGNPVITKVISWDDFRKQSRPETFCGLLDSSSAQIKVSNLRCTSTQPSICEIQPTYEMAPPTSVITGATIVDPGDMTSELVETVGERNFFGVSKANGQRNIMTWSLFTTTTRATHLPNYDKATPTSPSQGATIVDPGDSTDKLEGTGSEGNIVGVSKADEPETSMTGSLWSSMKTVVAKGSSNTPTQNGLDLEDNTGDKVPTTVDVPVSSTDSKNNEETVKNAIVSEKEKVEEKEKEKEQKDRQTTTEHVYEQKSTPLIVNVQESTSNVVFGQKSTSKLASDSEKSTKTEKSATDNSGSTQPERLPTTGSEERSTTNRPHKASTTSPPPSEPLWTSPDTPQPTMVDWVRAYQEFEGCYVPGTGGSLRNIVTTARKVYREGLTHCPTMRIGSVSWPSTKAGETANVSCPSGQGIATFRCSSTPMCWHGEPDITGCISKKLQNVLKRARMLESELAKAPPSVEEAIELTSLLSGVTEAETSTMEDLIVTSQILTALTRTHGDHTFKDTRQVKAVIQNVAKVGSNLVSGKNAALWKRMSRQDRVRSASSLLVAIETASVAMAEQIGEPTVIISKNDDIEVEVRIIDTDSLQDDTQSLVYDSEQSENSFSIPVATLKSLTKGKFAPVVFITHKSMSTIMSERPRTQSPAPSPLPDMAGSNLTREGNNGANNSSLGEEDGPKIASRILSASVGGDRSSKKLPKPVSFVMQHLEEVSTKYIAFCSFWDIRQDPKLGFWSQDGCHVVSTNKTHTSCECDHMTNFAILLDVHGMEMSETHKFSLRLISMIGCFISAISLLASWVTFQCFASLQGERNSIHKNLALTLFVAEILFVFGIDQVEQEVVCSVIAGFLHFFFLAAFTWMFIEGLHIIFMLVQVFDASRSRLPYYYLAGYGVPFVVVGTCSSFFYDGYGTTQYCWLTTGNYFIWAFAGPVATILLINAVFLTYAMSTVCRHSDYVFNSKDKTNTSGIRAWVQGALALEVLLGLTWTLGYFLINEDSMPLAYGFAILNSLQGLFIFIFHCLLNKKAQKEYRQIARNVVRRTPSSVTTQSTITKRTNHTNNSHELNNSPTNSHQKLNSTNSHSLA